VQRLEAELADMMKRKQKLAQEMFNQQFNLLKNPPNPAKATGDADIAPPPPDSEKH
jgi:hypothetical protein